MPCQYVFPNFSTFVTRVKYVGKKEWKTKDHAWLFVKQWKKVGGEEEGSVRWSMFMGSCVIGSTGESYWLVENETGNGALELESSCCISEICGK